MKINTSLSVLVLLFLTIVSCKSVQENRLTLSPLFGDHMVIQANQAVNVWGETTPSQKVEVLFRDQKIKTKADKEGKWNVVLSEEAYGDPGQLIIQTRTDTIRFVDVLVGEVWICSGQSNMEMPLVGTWATVNNVEEEAANANYPEIRMFKVGKNIAFEPVDTIHTEGWMACTPELAKDFSATGYFFGRKIHKDLTIPVGLIQTAWGGTVAEAWTSRASLETLHDFDYHLKATAEIKGTNEEIIKEYEEKYDNYIQETIDNDPGFVNGEPIYAAEKTSTKDWLTVDLPVLWEQTELGNFDGSCWFVKDVQLSASFIESGIALSYGGPDDDDEVWFNGVKLGAGGRWRAVRHYNIPQDVVKAGMNRIAIRIVDNGGNGGFRSEASDFYLKAKNGKKLSLANNWKVSKGFDMKDVVKKPISPYNPNLVTVLYNGMINPLLPFSFQGVIWYQGESNASRAFQYRKLFKTLITDWRTSWGQGDFPFIFVQLASYNPRNAEPVEDSWAELREAQTMALELPNTGMAVAIDIGDALDIHPGNKQDVGKRLALNALAWVYGEAIPFSGPMYQSMEKKGGKIELAFDHVYGGLMTDGDSELKGFAIAGEDKIFYWADAVIEDGKVLVSSDKVPDPVAVRYAWSTNPECNLKNLAGLPASPFRTDSWKRGQGE